MRHINEAHSGGSSKVSAASYKSRLQKRNNRQGFLMVLPLLLGFCIFTLYPIVWVFGSSLFDYDMVSFKFIGIDNFGRIFTRDPGYWHSLVYTIFIVLCTLCIQVPLALAVANLLNSKIVKAKTMFRTVFYMPNVISVAIVGLIFSFMFSSYDGIINNILQSCKLIDAPVNWFSTTIGATGVIVVVSVWQGFGVNMLFFLSGLMGIPGELYEAAAIDGASAWQKFKNITFPMLMPMMQIICMLSITSGLKSSDLMLVLTNGAPAGTTEVVMTYIFKKFFVFGSMDQIPQVGYAASLGVVTSVVIGIITVIYFKMTKKLNQSVY